MEPITLGTVREVLQVEAGRLDGRDRSPTVQNRVAAIEWALSIADGRRPGPPMVAACHAETFERWALSIARAEVAPTYRRFGRESRSRLVSSLLWARDYVEAVAADSSTFGPLAAAST